MDEVQHLLRKAAGWHVRYYWDQVRDRSFEFNLRLPIELAKESVRGRPYLDRAFDRDSRDKLSYV